MSIREVERKIDRFGGFERAPNLLYNPTVFTLINGTDAVLDEVWSYQIANKFKNLWYSATAPSDMQDGMPFVDSDNGVPYLRHSSLMIPFGKLPVSNKTANYVILQTDLNSILTMNNAAARTFTLCSIAAAQIGDFVVLGKYGAGSVAIGRADADTIKGPLGASGTTITNGIGADVYSFIALRVVTASIWSVFWASSPGSWIIS